MNRYPLSGLSPRQLLIRRIKGGIMIVLLLLFAFWAGSCCCLSW